MDDYSEDAATFGDRLALAREQQGMSQGQLARSLGLRLQTVKNWEADRSEPSANRVLMLAGALNVSIVWLMTGEGPGAPTGEAHFQEEAPAGLNDALAELRQLRLLQAQTADRLARLEKRLRQIAEPG